MHEIMFASRVLKEAEKAGAKRFIHVEVGELVEITPAEMKEGLEKLTRPLIEKGELGSLGPMVESESIDEDEIGGVESYPEYEFNVSFKESRVKCLCGFEGRARIVDRGHGYCVFNCPSCGGKPEVLRGGEIKIVGIE